MATLNGLENRAAELKEICAELKLLSEAVNMHLAPLNKAIEEFDQKLKLMIETIQHTIELRSSLQIFAHTLETDPQQRWHSARLLKIFIIFPFFFVFYFHTFFFCFYFYR